MAQLLRDSSALLRRSYRPMKLFIYFLFTVMQPRSRLGLLTHTRSPRHPPSAVKQQIQCESKKIPPYGFLKFFPKRLGIFNRFFTHLLYYHFYTRLQIFIHISPTLTKLCHIKCDHLANFYISLELYLLSLLTEQMTSFLMSCHIPHVC